MSKNDNTVLVDGLKRLSADIAEIAAALEGSDAHVGNQDDSAKEFTFEEVRAILVEKSRNGFRKEVKAILTAHGVNQLSDVTDPEVFAAIVSEAEGIGNG